MGYFSVLRLPPYDRAVEEASCPQASGIVIHSIFDIEKKIRPHTASNRFNLNHAQNRKPVKLYDRNRNRLTGNP